MIENTVDAKVYSQLLVTSLSSFIDLLHENDIHDVVFQHDNATPHTATLASKWLESAAKQRGFTIM